MPTGIVLGNLGTPQSPSVSDVRSYLREFLMDPYVINKPAFLRWLLVNIIIAPLRSPKSAKAYQSVWMAEGSPLFVFSERLREQIQKRLGHTFKVTLGMRYGSPKISSALEEVKDCEKILLVPLYPQYAESSFETWLEEALKTARQLGVEKKVKVLEPFFDDPHYLSAQAQLIEETLKNKGSDYLLFSFHGLPESHLRRTRGRKEGDSSHDCQSSRCTENLHEENRWCYRAECYFVARQLAKSLGLADKAWSVSFQSRLGREPWIAPFTDLVIPELAKKTVSHLAVVMPAFTADCLETLEEIGVVAKEQFLANGGKDFTAIPCLNDRPAWQENLSEMIKKSL